MTEAFLGKLAEICPPCMVLLKVERGRMVEKELIITKHLFCVRHSASFLHVQKNLFHAKKIWNSLSFPFPVHAKMRLCKLSKVTELVRGRSGICNQVCWALKRWSLFAARWSRSITAASWWPWKSLDWLLGHQVSPSFWSLNVTRKFWVISRESLPDTWS